MSDLTLSLVVLLVVVVLFISNRIPGEIVSVGAALLLYAVGLVDVDEAFAGFGEPVVVFVASLFVVSEAIDATGITTWAGQKLVAIVGEEKRRLAGTLMAVTALLAALISPNGAVAALLPMAVGLAIRTGQSPSHLAMPLAFAATTGSLLVLTGTPVNLLVSSAAARVGGRFGFFEFAFVGVPCLLGVVGLVLALGPRTLRDRKSGAATRDFSEHVGTLVAGYAIEGGIYRLRVRPRSPLVGKTKAETEAVCAPEITLVAVESNEGVRVDPGSKTAEGDILVVKGDAAHVSKMSVDQVLAVTLATPSVVNRELGVVEIVVPPRSRYIGEIAYPGKRVASDLVVLAVQRRGRDRGTAKTALVAGDALLVQGTWEDLGRADDDHDVLVVDAPDLVRRQAVPMGKGAKRALFVLAVMVGLLAFDVVPPAIAALLAAFALVLLRVVGIEQAYRAISWTTVLLVAGLFPLSLSLQKTGAAAAMAHVLVDLTSRFGSLGLLAGFFVLVAALCQILGTMATALIVIPVALSVAQEAAVSPRPFLMTVTVATAAAFLTPIATSVNMMVTGPGGYRFGDFWKLGSALVLWFLAVTMLIVPRVWPF